MDLGDDALARYGLERVHIGRNGAPLERGGDDRLGEGMLGGSLGRRRQGEQLVFVAADRVDLMYGRLSLGQRARLVENDGSHQAETLKGLACAHQDAAIGRFTGAADDRQGRGDSNRAGVTHHKDA